MLNIDPRCIYQWQRAPLPAEPTKAAEVRQLRAANRQLELKLETLRKAAAIFSAPPDR